MTRFIRAVSSSENPKYFLPGEVTEAMCGRAVRIICGPLNGYEGNLLTHTKGTMSLYHGDDDKNGADTEFFIMLTDSKTRDGKYAAFARVIYGMETVEAIGRVPVTTQKGVNKENSLPKTEIIIESVYFVTIPEGGSSGNSGSNDAAR